MSREYPVVREVRLRTENCSLWWEGFMKQVGLRPGIKDKGELCGWRIRTDLCSTRSSVSAECLQSGPKMRP